MVLIESYAKEEKLRIEMFMRMFGFQPPDDETKTDSSAASQDAKGKGSADLSALDSITNRNFADRLKDMQGAAKHAPLD